MNYSKLQEQANKLHRQAKNGKIKINNIESEIKHAQRNPEKFDFDKTVAEIMKAVLIYDFAVKN